MAPVMTPWEITIHVCSPSRKLAPSSPGGGVGAGSGGWKLGVGGAAGGPISLLGYMRVEIFGAEDHGVVDAQVMIRKVGLCVGEEFLYS